MTSMVGRCISLGTLILLAGCTEKHCHLITVDDNGYINAIYTANQIACADINISHYPDTYTVKIWGRDMTPKHEEDVIGRQAALNTAEKYCQLEPRKNDVF